MSIDPTAASSSNQTKAKEVVGKRTEEHNRKWGHAGNKCRQVGKCYDEYGIKLEH